MIRIDRSLWNNRAIELLDDNRGYVMMVSQTTQLDTSDGAGAWRWLAPEIRPHGGGYSIEEWQEYATVALDIALQWQPDTGKVALRRIGEVAA